MNTVFHSFVLATGGVSASLLESLIFAIGVRYILALAPSAKSTVSGCTDNCQSVIAMWPWTFCFAGINISTLNALNMLVVSRFGFSLVSRFYVG